VSTVMYLDHHATTPVDPVVADAMWPWLTKHFGNPGSTAHVYGTMAHAAVEKAREQVAELLGVDGREIVFTSGATESNYIALLGLARAAKGKHLITTAIEHKAVLEPLKRLEAEEGFELTVLPVPASGVVEVDAVRAALRDDTALVAVMAANNEIGTLQPIREIAELCKAAGVPLHVDGAQVVGRIPVDLKAWGVDTFSLSGHKLYGPKGVGALYVRRGRPRLRLRSPLAGGSQERGIRPGTLATHQIVGLGAAAKLAMDWVDRAQEIAALRDELYAAVAAAEPSITWNGTRTERLPGNLNVRIPGVPARDLIRRMRDVACSTGSACASEDAKPSHVLLAIGLTTRMARETLRFGLGRHTTAAEIERAAERFVEAIRGVRADLAKMD